MGTGEGRDDLGQCTEMKMNQAADGVVMVEKIVIGGQRAEAGGTLEPLKARM